MPAAAVQATGPASVAVGGSVHAPITTNVTVPPRQVSWPVCVGSVPELASAFQPRQALRERVTTACQHGEDVVLTQHPPHHPTAGTRVLAGGGGVGKTQLAAWFAHHGQSTDLLIWVTATTVDQIITSYSQAAQQVGAPGAGSGDRTTDAAALLAWLRTTTRTWLIILDDITDPRHLRGWWPPARSTGWTLATTRLRGATWSGAGRTPIDIDVYHPSESRTYLTDRLDTAGQAHLLDPGVDELAVALGQLPLALSHAAAYMIDQEETVSGYLRRYTAGRHRLDQLMPADTDPDDYGRPVAVTLLLALDAVDAITPVGLARPALALAAVLDPAGHPDSLWATAAVTDYLTTHRTHPDSEPVTTDQARRVLRLLHRYSLLTHTPQAGARAVRIHALTARAVWETTDPTTPVRVAADALLEIWPDNVHTTMNLVESLRANTTTVHTHGGDTLWHSDGHPLLHRVGINLLDAGLHSTAITFWQTLTEQAQRLLGAEHPNTLTTRAHLAASYFQAGRTTEAITIDEQVLADTVRLLGAEHPDTLRARANLADSYRRAARTTEAITIEEQVLTDRQRVLGAEHPDTLRARANLAASYVQAERAAEAVTILGQVLTDTERLFGPEHRETLSVRANLAHAYWQAGRTTEAITIEEQVLTDRQRLLGAEHPDTLRARAHLAASYLQAERTTEAITIFEQVLTDRQRLLGAEHPDTLTSRAHLACSYLQARRTAKAITIFEQVLTDRQRLLGAEHPHTLTSWAHLAEAYWQAGRTAEAITIEKQVLADTERLLGAEHPDTLRARANLAASYRPRRAQRWTRRRR